MIALDESSPAQRLAIHLNDHRALVTGELALTRRARSSRVGTRLGHDLTHHLGEVGTDLDLVDALLRETGGRTDHVKSVAARVAERVGRLKLNGQLVGSSPLGGVVELEVLVASCHARSTLWSTLLDADVVATPFVDEVTARRDATGAQVDRLAGHLRDAVAEAFGAAAP